MDIHIEQQTRQVEYTEDEAFAVVRWLNSDFGTPEYHARTAQLGMSPARAEAIRADLAATGRFLSRSGHAPMPPETQADRASTASIAPPVGLQRSYA